MQFTPMGMPRFRLPQSARLGGVALVAATVAAGVGASLLFHTVGGAEPRLPPTFLPTKPPTHSVNATSVGRPAAATASAEVPVAHTPATPKAEHKQLRHATFTATPLGGARAELQESPPAETAAVAAEPPPVEEPAPPIEEPPAASPPPPIELPPADAAQPGPDAQAPGSATTTAPASS